MKSGPFSTPVMRPRLPPLVEVEKYLREMYQSSRFSNFGPLVNAYETRLAEFLGVNANQVVTCTSATTGLIGALELVHTKRVLVPNFTFAATGHAAIRAGKELVLRDIKESNWRISLPDQIEPDCTFIDVMPFGTGVELQQIEGNHPIIVDAAASLGAVSHQLAGIAPEVAVVFSLHATKVLGVGEGGFVVFGDPNQAATFRKWTNFGFEERRSSDFLGTNAKMSEIVAAFGLAALDHWEIEKSEWLEARNLIAEMELAKGLSVTKNFGNGVNPYWIIELESKQLVNTLIKSLAEKGIETRSWWGNGLSSMPAFSAYDQGVFPLTESVSERTLGLPFFRGITKIEISKIGDVLATILNC